MKYFYGDRRYIFGDRDASIEVEILPWNFRFSLQDCENSEFEMRMFFKIVTGYFLLSRDTSRKLLSRCHSFEVCIVAAFVT